MALVTLKSKLNRKPQTNTSAHTGPPSVNCGKTTNPECTTGTSTDEQKAHNAAKVRAGDPFIFIRIRHGTVENSQPLTDIPPATLTRLAMLACHVGYDDNTLMRIPRGGTRHMTLRDIKKCLNLPRATFNRFWGSVYSEKPTTGRYIYGNDTNGYTLTDLFSCGSLMRGRSVLVQKMYINTLQKLYYGGRIMQPDGSYRDISPTDHRAIGRVLLLIPYLHEELNALCWNPYETDAEKILPLTNLDIAQILGIDPDHISREIRKLMDITVTVEIKEKGPKEMHLFARCQTGSKTIYFTNSALLYFGSAEGYARQLQSEWLYVKNTVPHN